MKNPDLKSFIDVADPFYRPLWRRIAIVAVTLLWFLFETVVGGQAFWIVVSGAVTAICLWLFIMNWQAPPAD